MGADEPLAKAVCGGCHAEGAGDQKFCAHCGEPLAKAADFDAGMAALEDLYTTTRQSPDELTVEEHSWGTPQVGDLLKGQGADGVIAAARCSTPSWRARTASPTRSSPATGNRSSSNARSVSSPRRLSPWCAR